MGLQSFPKKIYQTLASVRTGIFFIILVGIFSAVGTVIMQRPTNEPDALQRAYSPETLAWLDRLGLTDVFHAWWYLVLMGLFSLSLILVSIDRWPTAWRFYARPYRYPESHFRATVGDQVKIPVGNSEAALATAQGVLSRFGYKPERVTANSDNGVYAEKHRFSVFAVYLVHASLLMIFAGGIIDGIVGYRGNIQIPEGDVKNVISVRDNKGGATKKVLSFGIRCDSAGQETYEDGSPKKWWSKLTIVQDGREVGSKEIVVNDPFVYKGIRLYQASMGESGKLKSLSVRATDVASQKSEIVELAMDKPAKLSNGATVSIARFVPDYYVQDNEVFTKSEFPENPAIQFALTTPDGQTRKLWLIPSKMNSTRGQDAPVEIEITEGKLAKWTGLEVSYQPGQFAVWAGVLLMAIGLTVAFYMQHQRFWAVVFNDEKLGKVLWFGGATNKNRDRFQTRFREIKAALESELGGKPPVKPEADKAEKTLARV